MNISYRTLHYLHDFGRTKNGQATKMYILACEALLQRVYPKCLPLTYTLYKWTLWRCLFDRVASFSKMCRSYDTEVAIKCIATSVSLCNFFLYIYPAERLQTQVCRISLLTDLQFVQNLRTVKDQFFGFKTRKDQFLGLSTDTLVFKGGIVLNEYVSPPPQSNSKLFIISEHSTQFWKMYIKKLQVCFF